MSDHLALLELSNPHLDLFKARNRHPRACSNLKPSKAAF